MLARRAARAVAQRRAAPASLRGFAAGDGSAPPTVAPGYTPVAVGLAAGGLFIGAGIGGGLFFAGALLKDGMTGGGEALGDRVKDGVKEGAAYIGLGAALSSSVAGLLAGAVAVGTRLLRASQAEPAGGKAVPGPQCAGAADTKAPEHLLSADARAATAPRRCAGNCKPAQGGKA